MYSDLCSLPCLCFTQQYKYIKMYLIHQVNWYKLQCSINVKILELCGIAYILYYDRFQKCVGKKMEKNQGPALNCAGGNTFAKARKKL